MEQTQAIYDKIGARYNSTRQADTYLVERLYGLLSPDADGLYIDFGCGTGNYTTALAEKDVNFVG